MPMFRSEDVAETGFADDVPPMAGDYVGIGGPNSVPLESEGALMCNPMITCIQPKNFSFLRCF